MATCSNVEITVKESTGDISVSQTVIAGYEQYGEGEVRTQHRVIMSPGDVIDALFIVDEWHGIMNVVQNAIAKIEAEKSVKKQRAERDELKKRQATVEENQGLLKPKAAERLEELERNIARHTFLKWVSIMGE